MKEPVKRLPDTNIILRYLLADEPNLSAKAARFFEKVRVGEEKAVILESVLVECIHVLTKFYKVPKKEVAAKLGELLHYKGVMNADRNELIEALAVYAGKQALSIVDCILYVKARKSNFSLFSFDAALMKHSKKASS